MPIFTTTPLRMCELWEVGMRPVLSLPTLQDLTYRLIVTTSNSKTPFNLYLLTSPAVCCIFHLPPRPRPPPLPAVKIVVQS